MKPVNRIREIYSLAVAKRVEAEQIREQEETDRRRLDAEREQRRFEAAKRRKERIAAAKKRVLTLVDQAWIAAGESDYQLLAGRLNKAERDLLSAYGFSIRQMGEELELLDQEYRKIWGDALVSDTFRIDKDRFLSWLASEMGLMFEPETDDVDADKDDYEWPDEFEQRLDVFNQITIDLGLRFSLVTDVAVDGRHVIRAKRDTEDVSIDSEFITEVTVGVDALIKQNTRYSGCSLIPLTALIPIPLRRELISRYQNWITKVDLDRSLFSRYLNSLALPSALTRDLTPEQHYLMRRVKKKCLKWIDKKLIDEDVAERAYVVSWWGRILADDESMHSLSEQLAWLASDFGQDWIRRVDQKIEGAASLEKSSVTFRLRDDGLDDEREVSFFIEFLANYLKRLGYTCDVCSQSKQLRVTWV